MLALCGYIGLIWADLLMKSRGEPHLVGKLHLVLLSVLGWSLAENQRGVLKFTTYNQINFAS